MAARVAGIRLQLADGTDLADRIDPRFISLSLTEKRDEAADQLELVLHNHDGALATPATGQNIQLALGWKSGEDVPGGMVDKGLFTVDEVELSGPPDIVTIRARSANLTGTYRKRRTRSWRDTTLGAVLNEIAGRQGKQARIGGNLASLPIAAIEQEGKSDMAFVRDLGRRYDAVATWKDDALIFAPIGASASISGTPLARTTLTRQDGWTWAFKQTQRDDYDGAEAQWHDTGAAKRKTVKVGGDNRRKLKRVYATEAEAAQAAKSAQSRAARDPFGFTYDLAVADCALQPDQRITLSGWNSAIDAVNWLVESIATEMGAGGLTQSITLESG